MKSTETGNNTCPIGMQQQVSHSVAVSYIPRHHGQVFLLWKFVRNEAGMWLRRKTPRAGSYTDLLIRIREKKTKQKQVYCETLIYEVYAD